MTESTTNYTPRLKTRYKDEIRGKLSEEFGYDNVMQIPGLTKICLLYTSPSPRDVEESRMPSSA